MPTTVHSIGRKLHDAMTHRERNASYGFFGGPAATEPAKNYLRLLLARSADAALVAELRAHFNDYRESGDRIPALEVSAAIRLLRREGP